LTSVREGTDSTRDVQTHFSLSVTGIDETLGEIEIFIDEMALIWMLFMANIHFLVPSGFSIDNPHLRANC
jgi:hypothetical protein